MPTPEARAEQERLAEQEWIEPIDQGYNLAWYRQREGKHARAWRQITEEVHRAIDESLTRVDRQVAAVRMGTVKGKITALRNAPLDGTSIGWLGQLLSAFNLEIEIRPRRTP